MSKDRTFAPEFKAQVVLEILSGAKTPAEVCREHDLSPQVVNQWKAEFVQNAPKLFQGDTRSTTDQVRIAELERLVGQLTLQLEAAKKVSTICPFQIEQIVLNVRRRRNDP